MTHHTLIGADDHARIAEAIRKAEAETSGEIYAVLARSSDDYFFAAGFVATCGILIASVFAAFLAHWYWFDIRLPIFGLAVLAAFVSAMVLLWFVPSIRMLLVPRRIRYKRAHLNALQQFLARNVHITEAHRHPAFRVHGRALCGGDRRCGHQCPRRTGGVERDCFHAHPSRIARSGWRRLR
ncbi:conserved hypothetical protein [Brucella neotomae 5K33]|uniref:Uncharacterized protein n=1 Tax=Brucella neotomae 5K33 TaxID=520456 RepID=A0A7U8KB05_BRUNE|nr:conserved hypothetical protein [Brucella neotomae 5K33]